MYGGLFLCLWETTVVFGKCVFGEDRDGVDEEKSFVYIGWRWDLAFQQVRLFTQSRDRPKSEVDTKEEFLRSERYWSDEAWCGVLQNIGSFRKHNFRRSRWIAEKQDTYLSFLKEFLFKGIMFSIESLLWREPPDIYLSMAGIEGLLLMLCFPYCPLSWIWRTVYLESCEIDPNFSWNNLPS